MKFIRRGDRTDDGSHVVHELLLQVVALLDARFQGNKRIDALPLDIVRISDHGRLCDGCMRNKGAFHLGGSDPVSGNVDDIVDPPRSQ